MLVSVVLCTYSMDRYDDFCEAADSVLAQSHDDTELVIIVDGNTPVHERVVDEYGPADSVRIHCNDENVGLLESRNRGAKYASGEIVAFIDDDAVADERWVEELVAVYEERDAIAAGGKMTPEWTAGKPSFLPEEFYWLVGVTHRGFADGPGYVRNTFGSNISFRRDVFLDLDGFDTEIGGRKGDENLQGGETELCARLWDSYDEKVYYTPDAEVAHKVYSYRTDLRWLLDRAFWQGYSKRAMESFVTGSTGDESDFAGALLTRFVPHRIVELVRGPSLEKSEQLVMVFLFTALVTTGYLYGTLKYGFSIGA